jgi:hypothetical protein
MTKRIIDEENEKSWFSFSFLSSLLKDSNNNRSVFKVSNEMIFAVECLFYF